MLSVLAEHIRDNRFLRLIKGMLRAGYLEDWVWNATLSGAPQGGVVSPVLSNIYLDRLDNFVETVLIPEYTRGSRRVANPAGRKMDNAMAAARERGDRASARKLRQQRRGLPYGDPRDPGYRRLRYIRYADDHLLGFTGPKAEAEEIKQRLARFLRDELKLELSADKTLITHARTQKARFLGYDIIAQHSLTRPAVNGVMGLRVPRDVITARQALYRYHGTPWYRPGLLNLDDLQIISTYGQEYRGLAQYYLLAGNVHELDRLHRTAQVSMLKTLACKHRSTVTKMARKYKATIVTKHGPRACYEARKERPGRKPLVARFGGIPLKRQRKAVIDDRLPAPPIRRRELVTRLLRGECEWCGQRATVETHQVRKLADLTSPGRQPPAWAVLMAKMRRKTLIVCAPCHRAIHGGKPAASHRGRLCVLPLTWPTRQADLATCRSAHTHHRARVRGADIRRHHSVPAAVLHPHHRRLVHPCRSWRRGWSRSPPAGRCSAASCPGVPPETSYSSTCSRTQATGLGSYFPSTRIATVNTRCGPRRIWVALCHLGWGSGRDPLGPVRKCHIISAKATHCPGSLVSR